MRLPSDCSYAFVTGCQMAHVTALAAARHAVLARHGWDVEAKGLQGVPVIRVLANVHCHSSVTRPWSSAAAINAAAIYDGMAALPGATGLARPTMNQGLVQFNAHDGRYTSDAVIAAINASGEALMRGGTWDGQRVMRISVCGWNTNSDDVMRTVAAALPALR